MEIHFLASGSKGNACIIKSGGYGATRTILMVDCGLSKRDLMAALGELHQAHGIEPEHINGILISHEHGDHIAGLPTMHRKWSPRIFATRKTWDRTQESNWGGSFPNYCPITSCGAFSPIGEFQVETFPVSHDAADPIGFIFDDGTHRHAHLPDMGYCSEYVASRLVNLDSIAIECNYNREMLLGRTDCHRSVIDRTISTTGHMSDEMAATVAGIAWEQSNGRLEAIFLHHLSNHSITPMIAIRTMMEINPEMRCTIMVAEQLSIVSAKFGLLRLE